MMDAKDLTLDSLTPRFFATLSAAKRQECETAIARFSRWYGRNRSISQMTARDVEQYVSTLGPASVADQATMHLRSFLAYAHKEGATKANLATGVKAKKTAVTPPLPRRFGPVTHLTQDGYQQLREELDQLKAQRGKIAEELWRAAADKDFRENAPLEAAREHQGRIESRIRELEEVLNSSVVLKKDEAEIKISRIGIGTSVALVDLSSGEGLKYTLVAPNEARPGEGKLSVDSPVGRALVGRSRGEEVEVRVPAGVMRYRVKEILS